MRTWAEQQEHEAKERRLWVQELADTGMTVAEAARHAEIDKGFLRRMAKRFDITFVTHGAGFRLNVSPEDIIACHEAGMTVAEAARELRITHQGVSYFRNKMGLTFPDGRIQPKPKAKAAPVKKSGLTPLEQMKHDAAAANARMRKMQK